MADAVFVVGTPRSGTTLLASMIGSHSQYAVGPETHYFNKIPAVARAALAADAAWPEQAVERFSRVHLVGQRVFDLYDVTSAEMENRLRNHPPSEGAPLGALMELHAERAGKKLWVEKTPNHLLHVDEIATAFPAARIIRIVRDPRDSAMSMTGIPSLPDSPIRNAVTLRAWHGHSAAAVQRLADRCLTIRYEDLLTDPPAVLGQVASFLGVENERGMLDFQDAGRAAGSAAEAWKTRNTAQLDASRVERWRRDLPMRDRLPISLICRQSIREFGYSVA